jgi:hypothetical protein
MDITEQITLLIKLQKLDSEIYSLEARKREGPIRIKKLEDDFKRASETLKAKENELKALQVKQKDKENELASKEEQIKKYQAQLYQLKTNKEYTAMQGEIKGHEADKSVLEEDLICMLDDVEGKKKDIEKEKLTLKDVEKKMNADKEKVSAEIKEIEGSLGALKKDRDSMASTVDKKMLGKYERILKGKDGLAMVPVASDACGGCHMNLPPQVINEIKMKKELVFCESCARILYIEE